MPEPSRLAERYEIIEEVGRGGFAVVYKARDTLLDRIVALKVLKAHVAENVKFVQRFEQEARTAARFDHPHIVTIFEVGQDAGQHYITMTYLPGRSLDKWLADADGPLPLEQVIAVVAQVADALDYIHQRGSVHRDVKPSNVRLSDEGHATLLDFGIVRAADGTKLTTVGETMGTPQYMSPEQAEGQKIDHRSDIYSLGVMAYQMCTGTAPFDDVSPLVVLRLQADKAPPRPREVNPDLPASVEQVLLKALSKEPRERYQSAGDFARALREAGAGLRRLRRPGIPPLPTWMWAIGGLVVLGLVVGSLWLALDGRAVTRPGRERTKAAARTSTPTHEPTDTPAPTGTPTREPTEASALTTTPTGETPDPPAGDFTAGRPWTRLADGAVMVHVPGGAFRMGSWSGDADEKQVHRVTLDAFWIDQTEVTNAQYALCVADGECRESDFAGDADLGGDDYPVAGVSWHAAADYCDWAGARLPTEAEWEYAARGERGYVYPWGNEFDCSRGNFDDETARDDYVIPGGEGCDGYERTAPVGSFSSGASWCDAVDMAGNVMEWVADWYGGGYSSGSQSNPTGPGTGESRVVRGGYWGHNPDYVRSANRYWYSPVKTTDSIGFRCASGPSREPIDTPAPSSTPTREPTEPPTPTSTPSRVPTDTPAPTSTPTREPTEPPTPTSTPTRETVDPPAGEFPAGELWTRPADTMVMVYVPAATFPMGSDDDDVEYALQLCNEYRGDCQRTRFEDEQPVHDVTLDRFWIDQTEVTNAQFAAFLNDQGNQTEGGVTWLDTQDKRCLIEVSQGEFRPKSGYANHPVINISWYGAVAYCEWAGGRLPTEAEWEYAARGPEGHIFPWGDTFDGTRLNFCDTNCTKEWRAADYDDGYEMTAPVGVLEDGASWCGALDMAGNVNEWVTDYYSDYPSRSQTNPAGPETGRLRIVRGGSWPLEPDAARSANRLTANPEVATDYCGFRCAKTP